MLPKVHGMASITSWENAEDIMFNVKFHIYECQIGKNKINYYVRDIVNDLELLPINEYHTV